MGFGGQHPFPRRFGGNRYDGKPLLQVQHESLMAQRGAAFESDGPTVASIEMHAIARAMVFDGWEVNERAALQWDPQRVTDMLLRWEGIFKIRPAPNATDRSRRTILTGRWQRFGVVSNHARMTTALAAELGDYFVQIEYISQANAVVHVPTVGYPAAWNATVAPGVPWYSTVAHILVLLEKPSGATEGDFYDAAGKVGQILDPIASAFVTWNWYRAPEGAAAVNVVGGPSRGGFYLDTEHNLDNNVFSE